MEVLNIRVRISIFYERRHGTLENNPRIPWHLCSANQIPIRVRSPAICRNLAQKTLLLWGFTSEKALEDDMPHMFLSFDAKVVLT